VNGRRDPPAAVLRSGLGVLAPGLFGPGACSAGRGLRLAALLVPWIALSACGDRRPIPLDGSLPPSPAAAELDSALLASAESWNRKDLDGFMAPYLHSSGLTFSGSAGVRRGFDAVMRRYRENFFEAEAPLPRLRFEDLETFDLGRDHALMLGRYVLLAADSGERIDTGLFSLVWVRTADGWRIMHDHTSAAAS
jgi:ketosteroid isomerase-like protein